MSTSLLDRLRRAERKIQILQAQLKGKLKGLPKPQPTGSIRVEANTIYIHGTLRPNGMYYYPYTTATPFEIYQGSPEAVKLFTTVEAREAYEELKHRIDRNHPRTTGAGRLAGPTTGRLTGTAVNLVPPTAQARRRR